MSCVNLDHVAATDGHPGQELGLPATGTGSLAGWGRRVIALMIDWLLANLAAFAIVRDYQIWQQPLDGLDLLPLAMFVLQAWLLTAWAAGTIGQRMLGIAVVRLEPRPVGLGRGLLRTVLILLLVPPVVVDEDGRGLHDKAAGTVIVRR